MASADRPRIGNRLVPVVEARLSEYQLVLDHVQSTARSTSRVALGWDECNEVTEHVDSIPGCKPLIGRALAQPVAPARGSLKSAARGGCPSRDQMQRAKAWFLRGLRASILPGTPGASILQM